MKKTSEQSATKNALEWTVFGICLILVLGILGFITYSAIMLKSGPAHIVIEIAAPISQKGWYRVPVTVRNDGHSVAANVEVLVSTGSGETRREAGFSLDFVPRGGSRTGSVSFKDTGEPLDLKCEVVGYEEP